MSSVPQKPTSSPEPVTSAAAEVPSSPPAGAMASDVIDLPSGKELSELAAVSFATSRSIRWIVVAGSVDSGKTTLLTSLYELFQLAPVGIYRFAGSNTLPAWEQRCHLSRVASENTVPDTQRTLYKDPTPTYVHLRIGTDNTLPQRFDDILFTDVSGEMFEHARNSTDECKELTFLRRAEHFLVFLDSEKAIRSTSRWVMIGEAKGLLQSCFDSDMIAQNCATTIVWSKFDYFVAAGDTQEHKDFRAEVERDFRASFGNRSKAFGFTTIAARPTEAPQMSFGTGVPELLKNWLTDSREKRYMHLFPEPRLGTRESEVFGQRHPADQDDQ